MLIRTVAPTTQPIDLVEARVHCRAPSNGDDDKEIERSLTSAIDYAERFTGLALAPATFEARFPSWPCVGPWLELNLGPVREIVSIAYVDEDGNNQTVASSNYEWERTFTGARIRFNADYSFPALSSELDNPMRVTFRAGYDDPAADTDGPQVESEGEDDTLTLPGAVPTALLLLTEHFYDRGASPELKANAEFLLGQVKTYR